MFNDYADLIGFNKQKSIKLRPSEESMARFLFFTIRALKDFDFTIDECYNGQECIEKIKKVMNMI